MQSESFVFDPRPEFPYLITAKRYWHPHFYSTDANALTFICTHGVGFSKEHWEPTIEDLFLIIANLELGCSVKIREAWSIDAPTHGDAAVLNEDVLSDCAYPLEEYARTVHLVLTGLGSSIKADFRSRKLVGIGHSMGTVAMVLASKFTPTIKFDSIILVEPVMSPVCQPGDALYQFGSKLADTHSAYALRRKDTWPTSDELLEHLRTRFPTNLWDPRIQSIYVNHNARVCPGRNCVKLKCPRAQEAAIYHDVRSRSAASAYLHHLCSTTPVHFIYGEHDDLIPIRYQEQLVHETTGRRYASMVRIRGAGHVVPQTHPGDLAKAVFASLGASVVDVTESPRAHL